MERSGPGLRTAPGGPRGPLGVRLKAPMGPPAPPLCVGVSVCMLGGRTVQPSGDLLLNVRVNHDVGEHSTPSALLLGPALGTF